MATFPTLTYPWRTFTPSDEIQIISDMEAISGKRTVIFGDNIRTTIKASSRPLTAREYQYIQSFMKEIRGRGTFELLVDFGAFKYTGTAISPNLAFAVSGTAAIGDATITLNNTPNLNTIPIGSYVQFRVGGKIHQVISVNGTNKTITVLPSLYEAVTNATNIRLSSLIGTFRIKDGVPAAQQEFIHRFSLDFTFEEELP
jgi:hypothetical protein